MRTQVEARQRRDRQRRDLYEETVKKTLRVNENVDNLVEEAQRVRAQQIASAPAVPVIDTTFEYE
ncbi:hypothetical protein OAM67_01680 [bacterium]|nr:hypothetical protein [bacterium]